MNDLMPFVRDTLSESRMAQLFLGIVSVLLVATLIALAPPEQAALANGAPAKEAGA